MRKREETSEADARGKHYHRNKRAKQRKKQWRLAQVRADRLATELQDRVHGPIELQAQAHANEARVPDELASRVYADLRAEVNILRCQLLVQHQNQAAPRQHATGQRLGGWVPDEIPAPCSPPPPEVESLSPLQGTSAEDQHSLDDVIVGASLPWDDPSRATSAAPVANGRFDPSDEGFGRHDCAWTVERVESALELMTQQRGERTPEELLTEMRWDLCSEDSLFSVYSFSVVRNARHPYPDKTDDTWATRTSKCNPAGQWRARKESPDIVDPILVRRSSSVYYLTILCSFRGLHFCAKTKNTGVYREPEQESLVGAV